MKQDEVFDEIQKIGHESLNKYETAGGLVDICCGIYIVISCCFIMVHKMMYWLFIWWILAIVMFMILKKLRKMLIYPRIGYALFSNQTKEPRMNIANYIGMFMMYPYFAILQAIYPDWLPNINTLFCINLGIVGSDLGDHVWYYFIAAFTLVFFLYSPYHSSLDELQLMVILLVVIVFTGKLMRTIKTYPFKYWKYPKPTNIIQVLAVLGIAISFEFILFSLFRYDVTDVLKKVLMQYTTSSIGVLISIMLLCLGALYKTPRLYWYSTGVLLMALVTPVMYRIHINPGNLLMLSGTVIFISGIHLLTNFIKENPKIEESNFLEDKVLDDTK